MWHLDLTAAADRLDADPAPTAETLSAFLALTARAAADLQAYPGLMLAGPETSLAGLHISAARAYLDQTGTDIRIPALAVTLSPPEHGLGAEARTGTVVRLACSLAAGIGPHLPGQDDPDVQLGWLAATDQLTAAADVLAAAAAAR